MKLKTLFQSVQWINLGLLVLNVLNEWGQIFPGVDMPPWAIKAQVLLGIILPSVGGFAHRMAFSEAQAPSDRTAAEVTSSAVESRAGIIAATPSGQTVSVPAVVPTTATGTLAPPKP